MNRADTGPAANAEALHGEPDLPASIREVLALLDEERRGRTTAADTAAGHLAGKLPGIPSVRLPHVEAAAPEAVVAQLSIALAGRLGVLCGIPER